jgi:hypothetical protein
MNKYHSTFRSCNVGSKEDKWCCKYPKCLFVYIILAPFVSPNVVSSIFGSDMLNDEELIPIFEKLIGIKSEKPFECVGSCDEVNAAIQELQRQYAHRGDAIPVLLEYYKTLNLIERYNIDEMCRKFDKDNNVPETFLKAIELQLN